MADWDQQSISEDGRITAKYYVRAGVEYAHAYAIYNREPVGDKTVAGQVALVGKSVIALVDGKPVAAVPASWTQLIHQLKVRGPLPAEVHVKWRAYDAQPCFQVGVYLREA